jgi:hypothetical protein
MRERPIVPTRLDNSCLVMAGILGAILRLASPALLAREPMPALTVEPDAVRLNGELDAQQLSVTLRLPDGSSTDITSSCRYSVEPGGVAEISASGLVSSTRDGEAVLLIWRGSQRTTVHVQVKHSRTRRPVSFRNDVMPLLSRAGCNMGACHGNASGKGGFKLSLRGDDPAHDFRAMTREALGRRISTGQPEDSLVLLKPTGQVPHEGGKRFAAGSAEARTLRDWIAAGANDDELSAPRLQSLRVSPSERICSSSDRAAQLIVTARFEDGTTRDVTRQAAFDVNDPTLGEVTPAGIVRVKAPCELAVSVRYKNGRGVSRLAFLADRPGYTWRGPAELNVVDIHVFAKLRVLKIQPASPATDPVFLRRAYLDALGRLPSPDETRGFLADRDPGKRSKLIDRLLDRPEFADFWALKWADLLRNEEKTMGEKGVWVFQRWLRDQIAADVPLDEMVRRIVTARGSTWTNPPTSFYRTNRDPMTAAETVAQVFLGIRLQCARCHNHPFDDWTQDDYYALAACFTPVSRKEINNVRRDNLDKHEINGDEVIYLSGRSGMIQPRTGEHLPPRPPHGKPFHDADAAGALDQLSRWLTRDNPQFTRNLANRVWYHMTGRGIVEPVDDFRESNPPSNPPLLDALARNLADGGMRLKPLVGLIMNSRTYQLGSTPDETNAGDTANFARASVRLLPAEVLLDAIGQALEVPDRFPKAPGRLRATQLPGVAAENPFLRTFGKPERLLTCECERIETTTLSQAFQMINGESVRSKLRDPANRIGRLIERKADDEPILEEIYLASLCREPSRAERTSILAYLGGHSDRRNAWEDVAWALLNSKEFLLRH